MNTSDNTTNWVCTRLREHSEVQTATVPRPNRIQVVRKTYPAVTVGVLSTGRVTADALLELLDGDEDVDFVANVPKDAYFDGDAYALAARKGFGLGRFGDLLGSLNSRDVTRWLNSEFSFVERGLEQHSRITSFVRISERTYKVNSKRRGELTVAFLKEYELTADAVRTARSCYGPFDCIVRTNSYGRATAEAHSAASSMDAEVYTWKEFFGAV